MSDMFKIMTGVLKGYNPSESELKEISPFIWSKWLSGNPNTIMAANLFNRYKDIPMNAQYEFVQRTYSGKVKYISYPKNKTDEKSVEIESLMKYYNIRREVALEYLKCINFDQLRDICNKVQKLSK